MTDQTRERLYERYHELLDRLDERMAEVTDWQAQALTHHAVEIEKLLMGDRRKALRRAS